MKIALLPSRGGHCLDWAVGQRPGRGTKRTCGAGQRAGRRAGCRTAAAPGAAAGCNRHPHDERPGVDRQRVVGGRLGGPVLRDLRRRLLLPTRLVHPARDPYHQPQQPQESSISRRKRLPTATTRPFPTPTTTATPYHVVNDRDGLQAQNSEAIAESVNQPVRSLELEAIWVGHGRGLRRYDRPLLLPGRKQQRSFRRVHLLGPQFLVANEIDHRLSRAHLRRRPGLRPSPPPS